MSNTNYKCEDGKVKIKIDGSWKEPHFKQYENIEPLGNPGANGVVVKGTHKITGREDAIKIWLPRKRKGKDEIREEQYLAEVQKIAKLNDPRIAKIHDAWIEDGCYCCSMELIDGITYERWLKENSHLSKRLNMLLKIFEAIVFYQSEGIIHGDIHTKNILIGKNEEVHIIDFGTSMFSSDKEQSNHRENYLMYELVEKTLDKAFDNKAFLYKKYSLWEKVEKENDIRNAVPFFFSQSVRCYIYLMKILYNLRDKINRGEDLDEYLYEYCRYIAKGFYLSMDYFYSKISKEDENLEMFTNTMFECLEDEEYEVAQDNPDEAARMEFLSLFVYFEKVKKGMTIGEVNDKVMEKHINAMFLDKSEEIIRIISLSNDLFEFHNALLEAIGNYEDIYYMEIQLRESLYNIIEENYGVYLLHVLRYLHLRMEEVKLKKELYDRIIRLSYMYCLNNGIDYTGNVVVEEDRFR